MPDQAGPSAAGQDPASLLSLSVLDATRALLRVKTPADARDCAESLVRSLGGSLASADTASKDVIPADISFGEGQPLFAAAPPGSEARALLERHLTPYLADARYVLELKLRTERLAQSASTDVLTGLPNRRMIDRALGRLGDNDTVLIIDLDHFKRINDEFGHAAGDEVLRQFATVLRGATLGRDVVGRFGGEEFVAVLGPPVSGVDVFLRRLRTAWLVARPYPIAFSAGVARSVGDPDETVRLADEALYRAKGGGRDRWCWAGRAERSGESATRNYVEPYLAEAVTGRRRPAVRMAIDLLDQRVPREEIVESLLGAAQHEVGERWQRNELTAADEHLATGVATAALDALMSEAAVPAGDGLTVVTCAEGDWHSLAAAMFGESLRSQGIGVTMLGASTPVEDVADFLLRSGADSLAISCTLPIFFPGAARLAAAAHQHRIPVMMGGRAFGVDGSRAVRLGADAWAANAGEAAVILRKWQADPPPQQPGPTSLPAAGVRLGEEADRLGGAAFAELPRRFTAMASYDERQNQHTYDDLVYIVRFLAAAILVDDPVVFTDFVGWLSKVLLNRDVPEVALQTALEVLHSLVEAPYPEAAALLDTGRALLQDG